MTRQTISCRCLGGSRLGLSMARLSALALVAALASGGAAIGFAQSATAAAKPAAEPAQVVKGGYQIHQSVELGGRITNTGGNRGMWDTLVNQSSGARVLSHSLEMHTVDPSKTPFFDTLTTTSFGYGGDPNDVSYLNLSKGRWYDFAGSFRRDRQYFDYNLLANSLLSNPFVPEPDSPHLFNTVRRNTDTMLTLLPLSRVSFRAGFNHGTHEGPSFATVHEGADALLNQWFRNSLDTYTGGVDIKVAKRTMLSYDQFYAFYKGDSFFHLTGADFSLANGDKVSFGIDNLATATCGTGANKGPLVSPTTGLANPYCSGFTAMSQTGPTRTSFPTEQLRFTSHYFERVSMTGRVTYSGGVSNVNAFNETYTGLTTRTYTRQEIDTGGLPNGRLAHNKRVNVNADYSIEAELNKYVTVSDTINYWNYRIPGYNNVVSEIWAGSSTAPVNLLTPLSSLTPTTTTAENYADLNQKNIGNTILGIFTITPQFKLSAGWRYNNRHITGPDDLAWKQNWALLGAVIQPSSAIRINLNYDHMNSGNANTATTTNTYTRLAPDSYDHIRIRGTMKAAKWLLFSGTVNDFEAKNTDPQVNHKEHNRNYSFGAQILGGDKFNLDMNYGYDGVYSVTDICYLSSLTPTGTVSTGTCVNGTSGSSASSTYVLGNAYYNAPTNFGSISVVYVPVTRVRTNFGYTINRVDGDAEMLNPQMVPGALQSKYQTPFADLQVQIAPQWIWHGNWQYSGYGEDGLAGPTIARNVHGNVVTLGVKYAF